MDADRFVELLNARSKALNDPSRGCLGHAMWEPSLRGVYAGVDDAKLKAAMGCNDNEYLEVRRLVFAMPRDVYGYAPEDDASPTPQQDVE